jgi:hypothetical protein
MDSYMEIQASLISGNWGRCCSIDGIWRNMGNSQNHKGVGFRVSPEVDEAELDIEEHAERAYSDEEECGKF